MITITGTDVAIVEDQKIIEHHKVENAKMREFIAKVVEHTKIETEAKAIDPCIYCPQYTRTRKFQAVLQQIKQLSMTAI